jgi:hypothetical protein
MKIPKTSFLLRIMYLQSLIKPNQNFKYFELALSANLFFISKSVLFITLAF